MQKFWKSVKIWQSYREFKGGNYLRHSVHMADDTYITQMSLKSVARARSTNQQRILLPI